VNGKTGDFSPVLCFLDMAKLRPERPRGEITRTKKADDPVAIALRSDCNGHAGRCTVFTVEQKKTKGIEAGDGGF
jgi:hypothetical protein